MNTQLEKWASELYEVGIGASSDRQDLRLRNLTFKEKMWPPRGCQPGQLWCRHESSSLVLCPTASRHKPGATKGNNERQGANPTRQQARGMSAVAIPYFHHQLVPRSWGSSGSVRDWTSLPLTEVMRVEHVTAQVRDMHSHAWGFWGAAAFIAKKWKKLIIVTQLKPFFDRQKKIFHCAGSTEKMK